MDIHKPKAAHSLREFAVEIGTITIGILIALSLETAVEAFHNHELADHARADLRAELTHDRAVMLSALDAASRQRPKLDALIAWNEKSLAGKPAGPAPSGALDGDFATLSTSAWQSTTATGALAHMPYAETQAVSVAYAATSVFNGEEEKAEARWVGLSGFGNLASPMPPDQRRAVLADLRIGRAYEQAIAAERPQLIGDYDRALRMLGS